MDTTIDNIRFNVLRNALYHTARRLTFERWNRWFNFMVVVLGATAMGDFFSQYGVDQTMVGAAVAVVGAMQLVFDFGRNARDHQGLQRDYYNLLAEIEETIVPDATHAAVWRSRMIRIAGEEPPTMRALDAKAYNDALDAMEVFDRTERLHIPMLHRLLGRVWSYEGHTYEKLAERNAPKQIAG